MISQNSLSHCLFRNICFYYGQRLRFRSKITWIKNKFEKVSSLWHRCGCSAILKIRLHESYTKHDVRVWHVILLRHLRHYQSFSAMVVLARRLFSTRRSQELTMVFKTPWQRTSVAGVSDALSGNGSHRRTLSRKWKKLKRLESTIWWLFALLRVFFLRFKWI